MYSKLQLHPMELHSPLESKRKLEVDIEEHLNRNLTKVLASQNKCLTTINNYLNYSDLNWLQEEPEVSLVCKDNLKLLMMISHTI